MTHDLLIRARNFWLQPSLMCGHQHNVSKRVEWETVVVMTVTAAAARGVPDDESGGYGAGEVNCGTGFLRCSAV